MQNSVSKKDMYYIITITILVILLSLTFKWGWGKNKSGDVNNHYNYKTDTVMVDESYLEEYLDKKLKWVKDYKQTPPSIIYNYTTETSGTVEKTPDSILVILDSLKQRIAISDNYIKNFPKADKLIDFTLKGKNLDITTLSIDGITSKKEYPLFLDTYDYVWYNNELNHKAHGRKKEKDKVHWNNLFVNGGYEFLGKKPSIGLEYYLQFNRVKFRLDSDLSIEQEPTLQLGAKVGYRLF